MAADQIDTIIGTHVELTGSLHNQGSIQIHGHIKGDVTSQATVLVAEGAMVVGPITAKIVEVAGQVHGSVTADQVDLLAKSVVKGDVKAMQLSVKPGALFVGASHMELPEGMSVEENASSKRKPRLEIE